MKLRIEKSAVVITPTIGSLDLVTAVESVKNQTYKNLQHIVVADGREYSHKVLKLPMPVEDGDRMIVTSTPYNTGKGGWNGQRIYAAYPHLLNHDYMFFLDEDNWWDDNHVRSLIDLCEEQNLDFSYSLRKVYNEGEYLADDCCEAIGRWPIAWTPKTQPDYLVDTSAYCFRREFLLKVSSMWHNGIWGEDRRFFRAVKDFARYDTTGLHTLNYNLPNMNLAYGGQMDIFARYNEVMKQENGGKYPWQK